jgi:membrane-associated phospholipid phosphatase
VIERAIETLFQYGRGVGVTEWVRAHTDWSAVVAFAVISQLGDVWFLFLLGSTAYVVGEYTSRWELDRRRALFVLATVVTYIALVGVTKGTFSLARPTGAAEPPDLVVIPHALEGVFASITTATGSGFPSGHALGTTMVWGAAALVLKSRSVLARAAGAGVVVGLVSLSRLVLGVHYLVDVVVGAAVGLVVLLVLYRLSAGGTRPGRVLGVAVVLGLLGLARGVTFDSVAAMGGALGGWVVWRLVAEKVSARPTSVRVVAVGFAALALAAALFGVVYTTKPSLPLTFLGAAGTIGLVVGAPLLGERVSGATDGGA